MLSAFWSAKGGVGTTTTAALVAVNVSRRGARTLLVDLAGDLPSVLGIPNAQHGLADLVRLERAPTGEQIARVSQEVAANLSVLARGAVALRSDEYRDLAPRLEAVLGVLDQHAESVIVDCGCRAGGDDVSEASDAWPERAALGTASKRVLVTRLCYLSAARARAALAGRDDGYTSLLVVREGGRALRVRDLEQALGMSAADVIELDPSISRLVDCGALAARAPRLAATTVRSCAGSLGGGRRWSDRFNELAGR